MADLVDQPQGGEEPNEDLNDDVVSRLEKAMDSRFSGFQSILDKNIATVRNEFASQLEEVRRSSLTPEELEDLAESEKETELRRLKRENELLKMRKDHPDEVDFLSQFLSEDSFDKQLRLLKEFRSSNRSAEPTPREEPDDVSDDASPVDLNNPSRPRRGDDLATLMRNAGSMTREQAMKLLEATDEKGIMARLRRES